GIGIGIALSLKNLSPIAIISAGAAGAIATMVLATQDGNYVIPYINGINTNYNPLMSYIVVIVTIELYRLVFRKPTAVDLIIIPLFMCAVAGLLSFGLSFPLTWVVNSLGSFIQTATTYQPILMGVVISSIMGMILTAPISSVAIAVAINLGGIAGGAAAVGCCTQMIGFMMMSFRDNNAGKIISVGIGTSMLQFKNILRKPLIWLPTIIVSAILGPLATTVFGLVTPSEGAGMGTCALIGPILTITANSGSWLTWLGVILLMILGPALLVFLLDLLFRKLNWIKKGDLAI
ncbi:MAG: PTS sugar transporter subunit IIC, partial [Bacilli bacterium]